MEKQLWMMSLVFSLALLATKSFAGPITSGGGFAVVCRNQESKILSAEVLDLYEARNKYGFALQPELKTLEENYVYAVRNMRRLQGRAVGDEAAILAELRSFIASVVWVENGQLLPAIKDIGDTIAPPLGCAIEQVAIFLDKERMPMINSEIWSHLSPLNQAALVSHELNYKMDRLLFEKNSEGTRSFVAHIYAADGVVPVNADLPEQALVCTTHMGMILGTTIMHSRFYLYDIANESGLQTKTVLQFIDLFGHSLVTKMTATVERGIRLGDYSLSATVLGTQRDDWSVDVVYKQNQLYSVILYQDGNVIGQAIVSQCRPVH